VRSFDSTEYMNGLANQEVCIAMSWSSDYANARARARAVGVKVNLAFTVPKEGANETFSSLLIPEGAPHPQAAHLFINYILQPEVIAEITNEIYYGNDNVARAPSSTRDSRRCDAVSDSRDRGAAVPIGGGTGGDRAHRSRALDAHQDGQMTEPRGPPMTHGQFSPDAGRHPRGLRVSGSSRARIRAHLPDRILAALGEARSLARRAIRSAVWRIRCRRPRAR
jgi:hypothetical protein